MWGPFPIIETSEPFIFLGSGLVNVIFGGVKERWEAEYLVKMTGDWRVLETRGSGFLSEILTKFFQLLLPKSCKP